MKSLVLLIQDAHLCTSCARAVQSGALRPGAPVSKRLSCAQTGCRLKLMLCFPPVQKSVQGQFVSMMKPLHPFEVLQIKPSASKHAGAL